MTLTEHIEYLESLVLEAKKEYEEAKLVPYSPSTNLDLGFMVGVLSGYECSLRHVQLIDRIDNSTQNLSS